MNNQDEGLLKSLSHEIEMLAKTVDVKRDEITNQVDHNLKDIKGIVELLKKENVLLHNVPKKLSEQLEEILPEIGKELQKLVKLQTEELVQAQEIALQEYNKSLKEASIQLQQVKDELQQSRSARIKRFFVGVSVSIIISTLVASGSAYLLMKYFPTKLDLQNLESITIENSDVSVWGTKKLNVTGKIN